MRARRKVAAVAVALAIGGLPAAGFAAAASCAPGMAEDVFRAHSAGGPQLVARLDELVRACPAAAVEITATASRAGPAVQAAAGAGLARAAAALWTADREAAATVAGIVQDMPAGVFSGAFFAVVGVLAGKGPDPWRPLPAGHPNPTPGGGTGNAPCRPGNSWHDRDRCAASPR
ncbi:hypothetical protein [Futiania mangrovi]|uniref:Uncharacterized protein n=1 Tax=Futiania mangrovi TaxID=2959716 RepID=A0A9J6PAC6_9PROT|nr:hypothetical protein [Futiania mangrovii]MCP1335353.1 hypothetical protein [Futiania mangrovii]